LQIGKLSKRGPVGEERYSRFTDDELRTHITFWCIYQSPLMIGGNLPENRLIENELLSNDEVLNVDQHGLHPQCIVMDSSKAVWVSRDINNTKQLNVAIFNLQTNTQTINLDLASLGIKQKALIRDVWKKQDIGSFKKNYRQEINAHGAVLLKITSM
jgi:alpha-galactosidase